MLVHGDNLKQKEEHREKYTDADSRQYLAEIRSQYDAWHTANMALIGPVSVPSDQEDVLLAQRVQLFEAYKAFIDQQQYAEKFDSRSNLHSTVLEEFMYYLFKDLVGSFGSHALLGKSHAFKDIFFAPPNFAALLEKPYALIERKAHDFVIGATVQITLTSQSSMEQGSDLEETGDLATETHLFDIPAVAIECKTYLDKTMLEGSSRAAEELKARTPNGMYLVVMEWLKLSEAVNLRKYKVDQIYVLRKQRNTDREYRYATGYVKNPVDVEVVKHLFRTVRNHLTADWVGGVEYGLQRGWLIG